MSEQTPFKVICHAEGDRCHGCDHYRGKLAECVYAPVAQPVAWMSDDGRVINAHTKANSLPKSTVPSFHIPLYAEPKP